MPRALDAYRGGRRRFQRAQEGGSPHGRRQWEGEVAWAGRESLMLSLPVDIGSLAEQQQADGTLVFMIDFSAWDDPNTPWL